MNKEERRKYCKDMLSSHTNMPLRTLARLISIRYPNDFNDDSARAMLRRIIAKKNAKAFDGEPESKVIEMSEELPASIAKPIEPVSANYGIDKVLVLSDIHIPFHDNAALSEAIEFGVNKGVDCVILNGDICDCYSLSKYMKDPDKRDFSEELVAMRKFLKYLRGKFPEARIIYKEGNHEERFGHLLMRNAPALFGVPEFRLEVIFGLFDLNIEWVPGNVPIVHKDITIMHGHETGARTGGVHPARTALLRMKDNIIIGHFHRAGVDRQKRVGGDYIIGNSSGCLCDMQPDYMPYNEWTQGFIYIEDGFVTNRVIM